MKDKMVGDYGNIGFNHYIACSQADNLNNIDTFLSNALFEMEVVP